MSAGNKVSILDRRSMDGRGSYWQRGALIRCIGWFGILFRFRFRVQFGHALFHIGDGSVAVRQGFKAETTTMETVLVIDGDTHERRNRLQGMITHATPIWYVGHFLFVGMNRYALVVQSRGQNPEEPSVSD